MNRIYEWGFIGRYLVQTKEETESRSNILLCQRYCEWNEIFAWFGTKNCTSRLEGRQYLGTPHILFDFRFFDEKLIDQKFEIACACVRVCVLSTLQTKLNGNIAKITDFGLSRTKSQTTFVLNTSVGTGRYMAPELLKVQGYTEKIDVWAFGIILYEMVTGVAPFRDLNYAALYQELINKRSLPSIPSDCPIILKDIIRRCWNFDPAKRPSFAEIEHLIVRVNN